MTRQGIQAAATGCVLGLLSLAGLSSCTGPAPMCGAMPSGGTTVTGAISGTSGVVWSAFTFTHGDDCTPMGQPRELSVTLTGRQTMPNGETGTLNLCIPDPTKIPDGTAVKLDDPRFTAVLLAATASPPTDAGPPCSFSSTGGSLTDTATVTFQKLCGGNSTRIVLTFAGKLQIICSGATNELDLSGTTDVLPKT